MKKGFTLAEALVVMTVLGIIASITIPILNNAKPDMDQILYRKAIYTLQKSIESCMDEKKIYNDGDYFAGKVENDTFCNVIADQINTTGHVNCNSSSYEKPNFISTDGLRFWGFEGKVFDKNTKLNRDVYVDRILSSDEIKVLSKRRGTKYSSPGLKINISYDGRVGTKPNSKDYEYENKLMTSSFTPVK